MRTEVEWLRVDDEPTLEQRRAAAARIREKLEEELWKDEAMQHEKRAAWSLLKRL